MSYDIELKAKVEGLDKYVWIGDSDSLNITWNVHELVLQSSGWDIMNNKNNGKAADIGKLIEKGIMELESRPKFYKKYEAPNGWGTIESTLKFYKNLLGGCKEFPFAYVFVD